MNIIVTYLNCFQTESISSLWINKGIATNGYVVNCTKPLMIIVVCIRSQTVLFSAWWKHDYIVGWVYEWYFSTSSTPISQELVTRPYLFFFYLPGLISSTYSSFFSDTFHASFPSTSYICRKTLPSEMSKTGRFKWKNKKDVPFPFYIKYHL